MIVKFKTVEDFPVIQKELLGYRGCVCMFFLLEEGESGQVYHRLRVGGPDEKKISRFQIDPEVGISVSPSRVHVVLHGLNVFDN